MGDGVRRVIDVEPAGVAFPLGLARGYPERMPPGMRGTEPGSVPIQLSVPVII